MFVCVLNGNQSNSNGVVLPCVLWMKNEGGPVKMIKKEVAMLDTSKNHNKGIRKKKGAYFSAKFRKKKITAGHI